jgi:peptide/nickel transport system substrate-binding protein
MKKGQFEIFSAMWVPVTDPDLYYFVHHSASIPTDNTFGGNRHGYQNHEIDQLIELGRATMEFEKRKLIYQEIERKLLEDLPYIPLWNEDTFMVFNKKKIIGGLTQARTGSLLGLRNAIISSSH